jgi:hypothetical protein
MRSDGIDLVVVEVAAAALEVGPRSAEVDGDEPVAALVRAALGVVADEPEPFERHAAPRTTVTTTPPPRVMNWRRFNIECSFRRSRTRG